MFDLRYLDILEGQKLSIVNERMLMENHINSYLIDSPFFLRFEREDSKELRSLLRWVLLAHKWCCWIFSLAVHEGEALLVVASSRIRR